MLRSLACAALLTGCAAGGSGFVHDAASGRVQDFRMNVSGIRYARTVDGESSSISLFCAIPTDVGVYSRAMNELQRGARLGANEVLSDLRHDDESSCLALFSIRKVVVSADVYVMTPAPVSEGTASTQKSEKLGY